MGTLLKIGVLIFSICFFVFTIFFGRLPALRNTPIGTINRLLRIHIPNGIASLDRRLTNGRVSAWTSRFFHHLMNDRHPTVLILFILLLLVSEICWLPSVWPTLKVQTKLLAALIIFAPYLFLYLSAYVDPGHVTRANLDFHGSLYPYDHALYLPGRMCRTCNQVKPPRSKHCSVCGYCVSRLDHHCIFINGCVGYNNIHYFILLLLSTAILTSAGAYLGIIYLRNFIQEAGYTNFTLRGTGLTWTVYFAFWSYMLQEQPYVGGVSLLCILTSPLIYILYLYNIYLVFRGMTTNETGKWSDFQLDCEDGYVFRRPLINEDTQVDTAHPGGDESSSGLLYEAGDERRSKPSRIRDPRIEPLVPWRKDSNFIYFRTSDEAPPDDASIAGYGDWERVWSLQDVDNLYDLGFLANLGDVILPRKLVGRYLEGVDNS